jgi:two-component system, NarL family, nitrate/nitrite response regulator NarL
VAEQTRILLVDDHELFLQGLARLLSSEPDFTVAGCTTSGVDALALVQTHAPDIVLLDYDLGDEQGMSVLETMRKNGCMIPVLIVTAKITDSRARHILGMPATGIVLKQKSSSLVLEAIRTMLRGEIWLDAKLVGPLMLPAKKTSIDREARLTPREREVMQAVFQGHSNKDIAFSLKVSESAVKATLQQLFHKAGVRSRGQLIRLALEKHPSDWLMLDELSGPETSVTNPLRCNGSV